MGRTLKNLYDLLPEKWSRKNARKLLKLDPSRKNIHEEEQIFRGTDHLHTERMGDRKIRFPYCCIAALSVS